MTKSGSSSSTETEEDISNESDNEIEINDKESLFLTALQEGISRIMGTFGEAKTPVNVQLVVQLRGVSAEKKNDFAHLPVSVNVRLAPINDSSTQVNMSLYTKCR